jgi:hypothetical protein
MKPALMFLAFYRQYKNSSRLGTWLLRPPGSSWGPLAITNTPGMRGVQQLPAPCSCSLLPAAVGAGKSEQALAMNTPGKQHQTRAEGRVWLYGKCLLTYCKCDGIFRRFPRRRRSPRLKSHISDATPSSAADQQRPRLGGWLDFYCSML